jgi:hypothetical protein
MTPLTPCCANCAHFRKISQRTGYCMLSEFVVVDTKTRKKVVRHATVFRWHLSERFEEKARIKPTQNSTT